MPKSSPPGLALDQFESVRLGDHIYEIVPQPIAVLKRDLADVVANLTTGEVDASNILDFFTGGAYELLQVFIPDLMPRHEWEGFPSQAAYEGDLWDKAYALQHAPTGPDVKLAVKVCFKSNGLDAGKMLGKLVDPTALREWITIQLRGFLLRTSASALSAPGHTPSTTSSSPESPTADDTGSATLTRDQDLYERPADQPLASTGAK